jgi:thiamine-phosphate pyrophosphorylase
MERATYRIIDANFNRAREAVRVIEDYCRFALNSTSLYIRAKELRHKLSLAVGQLDNGRLLCCRDTIGDIGAGEIIQDQLTRINLNECLTAGCKRLTEALRSLAEAVQSLGGPAYQTIEALRYEAYELEKDIFLISEPAEKFNRVSLYIVITSELPDEIIALTKECSAGGADCIQLRAKAMKDDELFSTAVEFVKISKEAGALSIVNDRVDIAVASGADGVHLGQNDLPVDFARRLQLTPLIIGKSTHSLSQLRATCAERPTYVSLGPVFNTKTKPKSPPVGLEYIRQSRQILADSGIGHVAIGGITLDNIEEVISAGVNCISVCSAVIEAKDPRAICKAMKEKISHLVGNLKDR